MTSPPRHFTPTEVEALIPRLTAIMERVKSAHQNALAVRERLRAEGQRINFSGGGVLDQAQWRRDTETAAHATRIVQKGLGEIQQLGGVPKDLELGLVDFPHLRRGQEVHLCWKHGEAAIRFWHGLDEGYAARKPL
ncbi:MAG: DUF2203 domain-containing protein [Candidatus Rokuibacteriota bacterium]